jgi:sensor domain CHASE-containing protein
MTTSPLQNRPLRRSVIAALLALTLLLPACWWIGLWFQEKLIAEKRSQVAEILTVQGLTLGAEINGRLAVLKALKNFVEERLRADPAITPAEFAAFGAGLSNGTSGVRRVSIAPGGVTRFIYPAAINESLTGQDLLRDARPQIRADVQRAVRTRRVVISGPYALRPKGLELVARQPLYTGDSLWGLVSVVLDLPPILTEAGLDSPPQGLQIALLDVPAVSCPERKPYWRKTPFSPRSTSPTDPGNWPPCPRRAGRHPWGSPSSSSGQQPWRSPS